MHKSGALKREAKRMNIQKFGEECNWGRFCDHGYKPRVALPFSLCLITERKVRDLSLIYHFLLLI